MARRGSRPRRFKSRGDFRLALENVYDLDGYGSASLAIWLPAPSGSLHLSQSVPAGEPKLIAAWPAGEDVVAGWLHRTDFEDWLKTEAATSDPEVVIADPRAPELRAAAEALGYCAELPGQITGYWYEGDETNEQRVLPSYDPTGALLLSSKGDEALDLVQVGFEWRVLSHAAIFTYVHTTGIRRDEKWRLVTYEQDGSVGRQLMVQPPLGEIDRSEIERRFGSLAAARSKSDERSVLLRVHAL